MNANSRALVVRALIAAGCLGAVLMAGACTRSNQDEVTTETPAGPTVTVRATVTATPEPTPPSSEEPAPVEAPFAAVVSISSLNVAGSSVTVAGYVQGIVEEGGSCVFVAQKIDAAAFAQTETIGIDNVSTTSCGSDDIPASSFSRGSWEVTLKYTALDGQSTTSEPLALEIP